MKDFRGRKNKEAAANQVKGLNDHNYLLKVILGLANRVKQLEDRLNSVTPTAKIADWRSMATVKLLELKNVVTFDEVVKLAEELEITNFEQDSAEEDLRKGLLSVFPDTQAEVGHFGTFTLDVFKDDKELEFQKVVRAKVQIGKNELFHELDDALVGMKVGEVKSFPLNLMGQTDTAKITLLGLKKKLETDSNPPNE
jgi:hypothetical protein